MRFRTLMLAVAVICLAAGTAVAADKTTPPKTAVGPMPAIDAGVRAYMEGFEGAFPPAGWTQTITNGSYTWFQDNLGAFEGNYFARVPWQAGVPQDERLAFQATIDSGANEDHLVFATAGNTYWATNANFTVEVDGAEVYNFLLEFTAGAFVWDLVDVDLSAYDGSTVTVEFIYAGDDGADQHLDAVTIGEGYTPPPPPSNDDCSSVIDLQEQSEIQFQVDLCLASDTFSPGEYGTSCTGYTATGNDVVYSIQLNAGEAFMATEDGDYDMSMYLVRDCYDTVNTCVAGSDMCCSGAQELVSWTADADGIYYLIVDGYSGCGLVTVTIMNPVSTESSSWGDVKVMYR